MKTNKQLMECLKAIRVLPELPPEDERLRVYNYLLKAGFSEKEAEDFDCLGREYEIARDAMLYSEICTHDV